MSVIEDIEISTIEVTDEDIEKFLPDKVCHIFDVLTPNDLPLCGETNFKYCCNKAAPIEKGELSCPKCGTPLCSFCLLLMD